MVTEVKINGNIIRSNSGSIRISGGRVFVGNQDVTPDSTSITVNVSGNVDEIIAECGDINVKGTVGSIESKNGNVRCGDVKGNVTNKNGNISCGKVFGDATTKNGNIN